MEDQARRLKRIRLGLMRSKRFAQLGPIMMMGKCGLHPSHPTAFTNGRDEYYGEAFIASLQDKQLGFVVCHENMHKAARHVTLYQGLFDKNPTAANMATDYWINGRLKKLDPDEEEIAMPDGGLYDEKYDGWTVTQIFEDIMKDAEASGGGDGDGGFDEHGWEEAKELSKEEREKLEADVKQAILQGIQAAKAIGSGGMDDPLELGQLTVAKVHWTKALADFVRTTCRKKDESSWRRPNRRFLHSDIIMPTLEGKGIRELVAAVDASGSMFCGSPTRFTMVMSEVATLVKQIGVEKFHLIYWDGYVERHETYTQDTMGNVLDSTQPRGGGGTSPACVPEYLRDKQMKPDAVIMLTDGEVYEWGTWDWPVLWVITSRGITAPCGKTVSIE